MSRSRGERTTDLHLSSLGTLGIRSMNIVLGMSDDYERFSYARDHASKPQCSLRELAQRLKIHPSALSRSNFTLTDARRRQAAVILGVAPGFLARGWKPPTDLPHALRPLYALSQRLVQALRADSAALASGWIRDARLAAMTQATATAALPEQPAVVIDRLVQLCHEHGRRQLERRCPLALTVRDWMAIIDSLVAQALRNDAANLHLPELKLAKRLVHKIENQDHQC